MNRIMSDWLTSGRSIRRSTPNASTNITTTVSASARKAGTPCSCRPTSVSAANTTMMPWAKLNTPGRLEDQHEAKRDQRIEHAGDEAVPQRLHQKIRRRAHLHERIDEDFVEDIHRPTALRALSRR